MEDEEDPTTKIVNQTLGYFVEEYKPHNIAFPVLPNTYSLWRKYAYKKVQQLAVFKSHERQSKFAFYLLSECHFLKIFTQKVANHLKHQQSTQHANASIPETVTIDNQIMKKYNNILQLHSLYQQLLQDVTHLPYVDQIYPENKNYQLKEQFCPDIVGGVTKDKVADKAKNVLVNKGFGILAQKIFTKTFILQASSMAIRLNPLSMVASYAFSQLVSKYRKEKKGEELSQKIQQALQVTQKKAQDLKILYQQCIGLLGPAIKVGGAEEQKFIAKLKEVLVQDWLSIQKTQDDDGWQIVQLHDSDEFHSL